jgi:5-(carboxyamino)imidazole ribonucleotide mutase
MNQPQVGIIMGSTSDWDTMKKAEEVLQKLGVTYEVKVVSAHRTPDLLFQYAETAAERGMQVVRHTYPAWWQLKPTYLF